MRELHQKGSSIHMPQNSLLQGTLTKDYKIFTMMFTNDLHIEFIFSKLSIQI
jgi:hypothetical protein